MAWDLWSSSYDKVVQDSNHSDHPGCQCDFYFGCGHDVIEEDALNEKSCIQVLRILITKEDNEHEELEKDLLSLQNELACAEHENWPEICCSALSEKINWLDVSIRTLKNDHAGDIETQLLLHNKTAGTIHEIMKALQRDCCQDAYGQRLNVKILNPSVNVAEHVVDESSNITSDVLIKEEAKELCGTSENSRSSKLLLEFHEKRSDCPEKIEELLAKTLVRDPDLGSISSAPGHSDGINLSGASNLKVTGNKEVRRSQLVIAETGQILNSFFSTGKGNTPKETKQENAIVIDGSAYTFRLAAGIKGKKKCLGSRLGASQQAKSGNSDSDQKLRDFAPKTERKVHKKKSMVPLAKDVNSKNTPLRVVYPQELCLADNELCSLKRNNSKLLHM